MKRTCAHCQQPFSATDLVREESKGMEAERKALGLEGVRFLYYRCSACGYADIFVDVLRREGESADAFHQRRADLEGVVRQLRGDGVEVVLSVREFAAPSA